MEEPLPFDRSFRRMDLRRKQKPLPMQGLDEDPKSGGGGFGFAQKQAHRARLFPLPEFFFGLGQALAQTFGLFGRLPAPQSRGSEGFELGLEPFDGLFPACQEGFEVPDSLEETGLGRFSRGPVAG